MKKEVIKGLTISICGLIGVSTVFGFVASSFMAGLGFFTIVISFVLILVGGVRVIEKS